ncbi:DUF6302 family protein [Streptomyces tubercidicus]|uniref:DUF6302 family protein n=1 Tax=Streptomyces tubercidicus TaxID=47759 RepID=UPI0030E07FDD
MNLARLHDGLREDHRDAPESGAHGGEPLMPQPVPAPDGSSLLTRVLEAFARWTPLDVEALLDDVADALDSVPPALDERLALLQRLHAHLEQLERIALAHGACEREPGVVMLVVQSRTLRAAGPTSSDTTHGGLRQAGNVVSGLVDHLVASRLMKGPEASTAHLRLKLTPARRRHALIQPRRRLPARRHRPSNEGRMNLTSTRARLLPARDAYDYEYFRARLADPHLADAGVAVALVGAPLLAVPVGGMRRGGYASFGHVVDALQVRALLGTVPGFPALRVRWSPYRDTCHTVEWGEPAPQWWEGDEAFGRFFGYSDHAVAAFMRQRSQTPSSASSATADPRPSAAT